MPEEVLRKGLWKIKKQEAHDTEALICMQLKKMKTHARKGFEKRLCRIKKQESKDAHIFINMPMKKMKSHVRKGFEKRL